MPVSSVYGEFVIIQCPHCEVRYQILKSDLFEGPMRARCDECQMIFPLNDHTASGEIPALTLPPGTLIKLTEGADYSHLDAGPEWVGEELMGPLVMLSTQPPPKVRLNLPKYGIHVPDQPITEHTQDPPAEPKGFFGKLLGFFGN